MLVTKCKVLLIFRIHAFWYTILKQMLIHAIFPYKRNKRLQGGGGREMKYRLDCQFLELKSR